MIGAISASSATSNQSVRSLGRTRPVLMSCARRSTPYTGAYLASSDALSAMTNSRSVKSWPSTDSTHRRTACGSFRTARPTETVGCSAALIHDHGLEDATPAARVDQAAQPPLGERDGLVADTGG